MGGSASNSGVGTSPIEELVVVVESPIESDRTVHMSRLTVGSTAVVACGDRWRSKGPSVLLAGASALRPRRSGPWGPPFPELGVGWYVNGAAWKFGVVPKPCIWAGERKGWGWVGTTDEGTVED